jgi:hypothetical protein
MSRSLPLLLLLSGCVGTFTFPGFELDGDDDDSAADDDDATADDDDATADDDDATPVGGDLFCGLTVAPPPGPATSATTGGAAWDFDFDDPDLLFGVTWTGCEAEHYWDEAGDVLCALSWQGAGEAYVAQQQSTSLVVRFEVAWTLDGNTCRSNHPHAGDRVAYYRVTIPYGDGAISILTDPDPQAPAGQMTPWATVPYVGQGDEPSHIDIDYATGFRAPDP